MSEVKTRNVKKYKALYLKEVAAHAEYRRQIQNIIDETNRPVYEKLWTGVKNFVGNGGLPYER